MDNNTSAVLMPELVLYDTIKAIFSMIKQDFSDNSEVDTILFKYFGQDENKRNVNWESFNYFVQAKELFINREIQVSLGYNMENSQMGAIHILLPSENGDSFGIGGDEGYQPNDIQESINGDTYSPQYNNKFNANYNLMITSENTLEVILIYNLLKAGFISLLDHLQLSGLMLPKLGGQDINIQTDLVPSHIFHRSFNISFSYEVYVPTFFRNKMIKKFAVTGTPITGINTSNTNT